MEYEGDLNIEYFHQFTKGQGVKIAVLDSEIDLSHREFEGRDIEYKEFIPSANSNYHGTAVTSLLVGKNIGVAPEAKIYHLKMLSDVFGSGVSWDKAFNYAMKMDVDVICMSIGTRDSLSPSMRQSLQYAKEKNIVILAPSGNEGISVLRNPAEDERVMAVGGKNINRRRALKSNNHRDIEAYAISEGVLVANVESDMKYVKRSGTSFSNAIVAGQVALIISYARMNGKEINAREFIYQYNRKNVLEGKILNMKLIKKELDLYLDL